MSIKRNYQKAIDFQVKVWYTTINKKTIILSGCNKKTIIVKMGAYYCIVGALYQNNRYLTIEYALL